MDINRKTAYAALLDVEKKKSYSNIALNHQIVCLRPNNEAFVRRLVYGVLENKILLDYVIDKLIPNDISKVKINDLVILRMGIYQLAKMDSVPEYAAVNECVILAKKYAKGRDGFINGVLRSYINNKFSIKLPDRTEDEIYYLSVKYSYAPWIIKLWMESYEPEFVEELLKAGNEVPDNEIRLNWLKIMKPDLIARLEAKGHEVKEGKYCQNTLHVSGGGLVDSKLYQEGFYSMQDEASQMAVQILDPKQGDTVIDVCAAPGGKTLAIGERMNNKGTITASDIYKRKVEIIDREAKRLGITNIKTRTWDATRVDSSLVGKADKVIADVPCSGLGVIRRKPEIKYKENTEDMTGLPRKQLSILSASSKYVKPGGILMYCTCTIDQYENERVVSDFLRKNAAFKIDETKQLLPNVNGTDGFFICKMKKNDSLIEK
ncbi:MAG: 16S rRNA (cytosine(967)-C(5))-methyltransferase RsmB [Eubacteriaceae bacterium]|nr:16S rRNA (cytosine(967)-C(5))-methyltransferase RsmB [Eubacteriaceae bacterium]